MNESTTLVTVVTGQAYRDFAAAMFESAREHFKPTHDVKFVTLNGREGAWPAGTMYRHHILRDAMPRANFVFLIDADAVFAGDVGPEILPPEGQGITATLHPGYVGRSGMELPFERRIESKCYVGLNDVDTYYCGGFVGGERSALSILSTHIAWLIDTDVANGLCPTWHDESALNRVLASVPPWRILSPAYCHPDADAYYRESVWTEDYARKIVMLDKDQATRGER